ncbi:TPA: glycosyltransferase family 4 protein [Campylobacter jejuni]|nr:glycosyltransferase family 4 protein [Campylobacter jejuni]HDZ5089897.1 glycosyltransferase family 4 protein [Campylobacter jejuni]HDZ5091555.1 glycosyltransferase family 4 protein [Campylobacter jejuni]HDZ5100584.1 glycosyltransferase family 4 protein [Campylobacter jejuni]HDZ5106331.1 glycosyltransferase family 4 protein [Campylobacter jejuni]
MKKINIFLKDITESGGGERVCINLANAFSKNYEVEIFSFYKSFEKPTYKLGNNVKISYLGKQNFYQANKIKKIFLKTFYRYFLSLLIILKFKNIKNEILLANDGYFLPFFKNKKLKYFRVWHINAPKKKKRIFNYFDTLIILSTKELEKWQQWHKNIQVIPNFLPCISSKTSNLSQKVVLSAGRMDKGDQKGFLRLIDIWEIVKKDEKFKEWKLHIVGDGPLKEELLHKIQNKKLEHSIILLPFNKNIEEEYLKASIYVMTSHFEGFGMVLAESASYAIPSVAFDINTGPSDIIDNEKSGFLIEDGNLQEFADKLKILMQDESLREKFGKNAKEKMQKDFSQEFVIQKWNEIINQILRK